MRHARALACCVLLGACTAFGSSGKLTPEQLAQVLLQADLVLAAGPSPQQRFTAYVTGYSFWDNTPRGFATIAVPMVHQTAGGRGTFDDPITLAVGYTLRGGAVMDFAAGTRFYLENLKRYAVVEDLCGDGPTPERGPCHIGYLNHPWIDIYIGAQSLNEVKATSCANKITGLQPVIMNPADNLPVSAGEIALTAC